MINYCAPKIIKIGFNIIPFVAASTSNLSNPSSLSGNGNIVDAGLPTACPSADSWLFEISSIGGTISVAVQPSASINTNFDIEKVEDSGTPTPTHKIKCLVGLGNGVGTQDQTSFSPTQPGRYVLVVRNATVVVTGVYSFQMNSTEDNLTGLSQFSDDLCAETDVCDNLPSL